MKSLRCLFRAFPFQYYWWRSSDKHQIDQGCLKSDEGVKGKTGKRGMKGDMGLTGKRGMKGIKGERGKTGDKGQRGKKGKNGERGEKGDQGEQGPEGKEGKREGLSQSFPSVKGFARTVCFMEQFFPHHQSGKHECFYKFRELRKAHFL